MTDPKRKLGKQSHLKTKKHQKQNKTKKTKILRNKLSQGRRLAH